MHERATTLLTNTPQGAAYMVGAATLLKSLPDTDPLAEWAHALAESITERLEVIADGKETA